MQIKWGLEGQWLAVGVVLAAVGCGGVGPQAASLQQAEKEKGGKKENVVRVEDPKEKVDHKTLTQWSLDYFRWFIAGADPNTARHGDVYFPQLPQGFVQSTTNGCTTYAGSETITVPEGTTLYLPIDAFTIERYQDGSVDPPVSEASLTGGGSLTIDGTALTHIADYYYNGTFDPEIVYAQPTNYGSVATVSVSGVSILTEPLEEGTFTLHVIADLCATGAKFDNVFTLQVTEK